MGKRFFWGAVEGKPNAVTTFWFFVKSEIVAVHDAELEILWVNLKWTQRDGKRPSVLVVTSAGVGGAFTVGELGVAGGDVTVGDGGGVDILAQGG